VGWHSHTLTKSTLEVTSADARKRGQGAQFDWLSECVFYVLENQLESAARQSPDRPQTGKAYLTQGAGSCVSDTITSEGTHSPGDEINVSMRSFFRLVYDRCGAARPDYLDEPLKLISQQ
jgi:hypothetical protein